MLCIMPTKPPRGRSWLVYKFAHPTHPLFNIMQISVITITCHLKHSLIISCRDGVYQEVHFEAFMRWVARDTSPSKLALLQDVNTVRSGNNTQVFPLKICSEVAMATIQEVLLWLHAGISRRESPLINSPFTRWIYSIDDSMQLTINSKFWGYFWGESEGKLTTNGATEMEEDLVWQNTKIVIVHPPLYMWG